MTKKIMQSGVERPKFQKRKPKWRLMLISDHGKIVAIPRHGAIFVSVVLVLMFFLFTTVISISVYLKKNRESGNLKKTLAQFEETVKKLEAEKEMLTAQLVLSGIEPEVFEKATDEPRFASVSRTTGKSNAEKDSVPENPAQKNSRSEKSGIESDQTAGADKKSPSETKDSNGSQMSSDVASLENFQADYDEGRSKLKVHFKLNNISDEKLSGYILVLLKNPGKKQNAWMALPDCPIENGRPSDYKKGRYFEISRYKTIRFAVGDVQESDRFVEAEVYIYNQSGNLLLRENFSLSS